MNSEALLESFLHSPRLFQLADRILLSAPQRIACKNLQGSSPAFLLSAVFRQEMTRQMNHLVVCEDAEAAAYLHNTLENLTDAVGGCERIAGTLIPYSYSVLLHRTIYIYCFLLPLGLIDSLGWMMPFFVTFIAYTYVALEAIADELETPFGLSPNDLALDAICRNLENSLLEMDDRPLRPDQPTDPFILL